MAIYVLHNATLIDGTGADPLPDAAVVVDGERITWAGPLTGLPQSAQDARRIDIAGNTICPGFFDYHVHFSLPGTKGNPLERALRPESYLHFALIERLRVTLENGVTTPRDLQDEWTQHSGELGTWMGFTLPVPQAFIHVAMFLGALTFMYVSARAVGDGEYREQFLDPLIDDLRFTLVARNRYLAHIGRIV